MPRPFFFAALLALSCLLSAAPLTFEVATVKPGPSGVNGVRRGRPRHRFAILSPNASSPTGGFAISLSWPGNYTP